MFKGLAQSLRVRNRRPRAIAGTIERTSLRMDYDFFATALQCSLVCLASLRIYFQFGIFFRVSISVLVARTSRAFKERLDYVSKVRRSVIN